MESRPSFFGRVIGSDGRGPICVTVNFDIFSILVICFIGLFSLGIYGLWETGIIPLINQTLSSQSFVLAVEPQKLEVESSPSVSLKTVQLQFTGQPGL
ncbi:MAG: hypothetical protein L5655_09210 [Thermosediminibacteraceae bacterium]|nr:hypothetical protein [Thermosediminibacteraceae bacterium]